jgi:hypothetical protein
MTGEFNPGTANTGEARIVSLVLPGGATSVKAGTYAAPTFRNFTALKSVSAAGIQTAGDYAFRSLTALQTVSFPRLPVSTVPPSRIPAVRA